MADEVVDTLEIEITANADKAKSVISDLQSSIARFNAEPLKGIADAIDSIARSVRELGQVKGLDKVIRSISKVNAETKKAAMGGKEFAPIIPPLRASTRAGDRTRLVQFGSGAGANAGRTYRFDQSAHDIAQSFNREHNAGQSNRTISLAIQQARNAMLDGNDKEMHRILSELAEETARGARTTGNNSDYLVGAMQNFYGGSLPVNYREAITLARLYGRRNPNMSEQGLKNAEAQAKEYEKMLRGGQSVDLEDARRVLTVLGGLAGANEVLKNAGFNGKLTLGENLDSRKDLGDILGADPEKVEQATLDLSRMLTSNNISGIEDLFDVLGRTKDYHHDEYVKQYGYGRGEEGIAEQILSELYAQVMKGSIEDVKQPVTDAAKAAAQAKADAEETSRILKEENSAWKSYDKWNREQSGYYRQDNSARDIRQQMNLDWKEHDLVPEEIDNTADEIAQWNADMDAADEQWSSMLEGNYLAQMKEEAQAVVDGMTLLGKSAKDSASILSKLPTEMQKQIEDLTGVHVPYKDAAASAKTFTDEFERQEREAQAAVARAAAEQAAAAKAASDEAKLQKQYDDNLRSFLRNNTPEHIREVRGGLERRGRLDSYMDIFGNQGVARTEEGLQKGFIDEATATAMKNAYLGIEDAKAAMDDLGESSGVTAQEFMQSVSNADLLEMKLEGVSQKLEEAVNADQQDPAKIARLAEQYNKLSDAIANVATEEKEASGQGIHLRDVLEVAGKRIEKSLLGQLTRIAKTRALRYAVRELASGVKEGVTNLYQWSSSVNGPFASAMNSFASYSMLAKNSLATALAPAITALIPLFNTFVGWINTASNALAQFFALLGGQSSWTKAELTTEQWADSTKKAAGGAGKAIKDLLADWDELNIIQSESGGGGGGSGKAAVNYADMFTEMDTFDKWTENFEEIKDIVEAIGLGIAAWFVVGNAESFLHQLGIASATVDSVFVRIKKGVAGAVLLTVAFNIADMAGKDIAQNGITAKNALMSIGSLTAAAIGGKWIGNAFLGTYGGAIGAIAGLTITAIIGLNSYITAQREKEYGQMAKDAFARAGTNSLDPEEFKTAIEKELNDRIGTLHLSIESFESYGSAVESLNSARTALQNLGDYVYGDKAMTKEQAEEFRKNWEIVFSSVSEMHEATWSTINFGIADAMKTETEEGRQALKELQQQMIELQRLTGGAQAAWREETRMISQRISSGTASDEDLERYSVLMDLISDSDVSSSLKSMQKWAEEVKTFDFGSGEEAVQNAVNFIGEMDNVYASSTEEINLWEQTQKDAIDAARQELEAYFRAGYIDKDAYDNGNRLLNQWGDEVAKKVEDDLKYVDELKNDTYQKIFDQVMRGYVLNQMNGGNGMQYAATVADVMTALQSHGYEWNDLYQWMSPTSQENSWWNRFTGGLFGNDSLAGMQVEEKYAYGTDYPVVISVEKPNYLVGGDGDEHLQLNVAAPEEPLKIPAVIEYEEFEDLPDFTDEEIKMSAQIWWDDQRAFENGTGSEEAANASFDAMFEAMGDAFDNFWDNYLSWPEYNKDWLDMVDLPDWMFMSNEENNPITIDSDASGITTDVTVQNVGDNIGSSITRLQEVMERANSILNSISGTANSILGKSTTVVVQPSSAMGRVVKNSNQARATVTGELV